MALSLFSPPECSTAVALLSRAQPNNALILGSLSAPMPGRTLNLFYNVGAQYLERVANRAAHRAGLGPTAVVDRIQEAFGDGEQRESNLVELRGSQSLNGPEIEKDCKTLIKYTLPYEIFTSVEDIR
jgi:hypothetical protein